MPKLFRKMKKKIIKTSNSYDISVIQVDDRQNFFSDFSITTLNYKNLSDAENNSDNKYNTVPESLKRVDSAESNAKDCSDFETAIKSTAFGKFNYLILFASFWGHMSAMCATTSTSLILPSAGCDLNLSNFDKGMLNSIVYIGMICTAFLWGLFSDAVGRKNVLIVGFALDAFFTILVGLAQNFTFLVIAKLFAGFISAGPISILASYIAENSATTYRSSMILYSGFFISSTNILLPLLAWAIIPNPIRYSLFGGHIILSSWRIFLLITCIPSIMAVIVLLFLHETPKFLMFQGKNKQALEVFKKIYFLNTGLPKETFPIKCLQDETGSEQIKGDNLSWKQIMTTAWKQIIPFFRQPYLFMGLLPCFIQFTGFVAMNSIRLWTPQLFAFAIENEKLSDNSTNVSTICGLLIPSAPEELTKEESSDCSEYVVDDKVYFNSMIIGIVTAVGYLISTYAVKTVDKKWLIIAGYVLALSCIIALFWSTTSNVMVAVISIFVAVTSTAATALVGAVVDIFPTSLRTTAVSVVMTFARLGAMIGNVIFPVLLDSNCAYPFVLIAVMLIFASTLTLWLPKTKGKNLE